MVARAIITPLISIKLFTCPHYSNLLTVIYCAHNLQNFFHISKMVSLIWARLGELKKLQKVNAKLTWSEPVPQAVLDKAGIKAFDNFKA